MEKIVVSVPGKIHLLGEHTVVYGKPALLTAIDKRCSVVLTPKKDKAITINFKNFDNSQSFAFDEVFEKTEHARKLWLKFIDTRDINILTLITKNILDYPLLAVGENLQQFRDALAQGFHIEIDSDIPLGSGCGSSAAIAVGISGAISYLFDEKIDKEKIFETALSIEQFKHGTPSGGDIASVIYGGFVWYQNTVDGKIVKPIPIVLSDKIATRFSLIDTGRPAESTGEMIEIVREFIEKNPKEGKKILDDQEHLTHNLVDAIGKKDANSMKRIIKMGEGNLEKLGVVSLLAKELIHDIEKAGGAAKISGGGGRTKGSGMVLAYDIVPHSLKKISENFHLKYLQIKFGAEGLKVEESI